MTATFEYEDSLGSYSESEESEAGAKRGLATIEAGAFGLGFSSIGNEEIVPWPTQKKKNNKPPKEKTVQKAKHSASPKRKSSLTSCFSRTTAIEDSDDAPASSSSSPSRNHNKPDSDTDSDGDDDDDDGESESENSDQNAKAGAGGMSAAAIFQLATKYPLVKVLNHEEALKFYQDFASSQLANDSVMLWIALSSYRKAEGDEHAKLQIWKDAIDTFLKPGLRQVASFPFSLMSSALQLAAQVESAPSPVPEELRKRMDNTVVTLQNELEATDLAEVYLRFIHTKQFQIMLKETSISSTV